MRQAEKFLRLLRELRETSGSMKRMKKMSDLWQFVSALSQQERKDLAVDLGFEGGDSLLERFSTSPGSSVTEVLEWADELFQQVNLDQLDDAVPGKKAGSLVAALKVAQTELKRREARVRSSEASSTAPIPPPAPQSPEPEPDQVEPAELDEPDERAELVERVERDEPAERVERAEPDEPEQPDEPEEPEKPEKPEKPEEPKPSSSHELRDQRRPLVETRPSASLIEELEHFPSPFSRMRYLLLGSTLPDALDVETMSVILEKLPRGWMRRRVLSHCLTMEFSDSFSAVLELITNQLERDFDFIWYLEALLSRSDRLASDELAMLEEAAPSPMILRIVKRRIDRALSE